MDKERCIETAGDASQEDKKYPYTVACSGGFWSMTVTGNYRIIFKFESGNAHLLDYLDPLEISITELAGNLGVARKTVSQLVNAHMGVSAEMALRLGKAFTTTPEFWLNMQRNYDLWHAGSRIEVSHIRPLRIKERRGFKAN